MHGEEPSQIITAPAASAPTLEVERVAVIADIHGNLPALEAVLADIKRRGVDRIIVNGDVVNRGPSSVEVMQLLLEREDITFTLGNHDDLVRLWQSRSATLPQEWFGDPFWGATEWNAEALARAGLLDVPADWPLSLTLLHPVPGQLPAAVAHGTPQSYREGLSAKMSPDRQREVLRGYGAAVGSHIHVPVQRQVDGAWLLNTGGVGTSADGDARASYLLLTAGPRGWEPELVRVPYDRARALRDFERGGYRSSGLSAEIFRGEVATGESLYTPYWAWTERLNLPRNEASWEEFLRLGRPRV